MNEINIKPINEGEKESSPTSKFWSIKNNLKIFKALFILIIVVASTIIIKDEIVWQFDPGPLIEDDSINQGIEEDSCNVIGIELHGSLVTYISPENFDKDGNSLVDEIASENIVYAIAQSEKDEKIKAIILEVDSYGGFPVAGEEVSNALKSAKKPTVALIRQAGLSAAYLAAVGANKIFASKNSDVGGIGVTMSYLDYTEQNKKEGLTYNELSSGKFKDTGSPDRKLSAEEIELLMRDIDKSHQNFIEAVAENRGMDIKKVESLADGSSMLGEMALQNGLIDQIGGLSEVEKYLEEKIGEKPEVCW